MSQLRPRIRPPVYCFVKFFSFYAITFWPKKIEDCIRDVVFAFPNRNGWLVYVDSPLDCHVLTDEIYFSVKHTQLNSHPVPEIIDPVFAKTSQNARFLLSENERFGLVFVKTGSINSGTDIRTVHCPPGSHQLYIQVRLYDKFAKLNRTNNAFD